MTDDRRSGYRKYADHLEHQQDKANAHVDPALQTGRGARLVRALNVSVAIAGLAILALCVQIGVGSFPTWALTTSVAALVLSFIAALALFRRLPR